MSSLIPPVRFGPAGFVFVLACAVLAGGPRSGLCATPSLPSFMRVWQTENGLPHNAVTAILQTRDGYLWLGTYDGLARFDGASFTVFNNGNTPGLRSSRVTTLFEDEDGNLWIGHEAGELTRYRDGVFYPVEVSASWENRKILSIGSDQNNRIWLLNEEGRLANTNGQVISAATAGIGPKVVTLSRNRSGKLWVACGGEIFALEGDQLVSLKPEGQSAVGFVKGACASHDGGLWIINDEGTRKWDGHEWTDDLGPSPTGQSSITTAIEMRSGCLAVGTLDEGLYLIFPQGGRLHYNRAKGFPHDWVRCLYEDREGTLWIGTGSGGVVALRAGKVETLDPPDSWQGRVLLSVSAAQDGALWIGTEGAGLYRYSDEEWKHFGESDGLSNLFVWSVSEDAKGRLWAGTWGGGMFIQQGNRFVPAPGLENITVSMPAILHGRNGVTWIGTANGLLRYEAGAVKWFGRKEGLAQPDVRAVVEDRDGSIWLGMLGGGLARLHNGHMELFQKRDGLSSDYVQSLYLDADGALWIGTYGGGVNRLKQGHFAAITTGQGLPNNFISDIREDRRSNFWMTSHGGIFRIPKEDLNLCADGKSHTVRCLSYGKGDGMPTPECSGGLQPAACTTPDGRIWVPTSKGLVVVDPNYVKAKANLLPPPVVIEQLQANGRLIRETMNAKSPLRIPPGLQRLEFHYAGLSFVAPEKVQFQYRLEGLDPEWGYAEDGGTRRTVTYNYVPPGNYTFHVKACNSDGTWNETGAALAFTVLPYFWQTWWFRFLIGVAAASLVAGSVLFVTRHRVRGKLELVERQRAIERERSRIAQDIHDNLGASLTRISLLSQSAHSELDNPAHAAIQLDRIYNTAHELTRALDEIVWAVNPQHDTLDSLADYVGKFAQDFLGPLNIRCRLDVPMNLPAWPLTAEVRHNLFLTFKEALHNVVKHAGASEVIISLATTNRAFSLAIRDNGKGFTPKALPTQKPNEPTRPARGNGLPNMQQRLQKLGGRCEIKSTPGEGTEVLLVVPVAAIVA